MKNFLLCSILAFAVTAQAETPKEALYGTGPYQWIQHGVMATYSQLDLAIQGLGFFALQDRNNKIWLTRDGKFSLNNEGFIVYRDSDLRLLSDLRNPIQITEGARNSSGSPSKSFRIELDGSIKFIYQDGTIQTNPEKIGIALPGRINFADRRNTHLFGVSDSESIYVGQPQSDTRGSIYSSSLEDNDAYAYALFENNFERPAGNTEGKYLITAEIKIKGDFLNLTSKKTRIVDPSNQWLEFSADDRIFWNAKFSETNGELKMNSLIFPSHYSCPPAEIETKLELNKYVAANAKSEKCQSTVQIKIEKFEAQKYFPTLEVMSKSP